MATKTTKKKGETATTVNVGIRIDPKIKFALDMMGRKQKRSLTAVIEWAISNAIAQQPTDDINESFSTLIDKVWSTDEPTRFANMAFYMPESLTYDELRIWETIKISPQFWEPDHNNYWRCSPEYFDYHWLRAYWTDLLRQVEEKKVWPTLTPFDASDLEIPF